LAFEFFVEALIESPTEEFRPWGNGRNFKTGMFSFWAALASLFSISNRVSGVTVNDLDRGRPVFAVFFDSGYGWRPVWGLGVKKNEKRRAAFRIGKPCDW
jgi:hypothetical protein